MLRPARSGGVRADLFLRRSGRLRWRYRRPRDDPGADRSASAAAPVRDLRGARAARVSIGPDRLRPRRRRHRRGHVPHAQAGAARLDGLPGADLDASGRQGGDRGQPGGAERRDGPRSRRSRCRHRLARADHPRRVPGHPRPQGVARETVPPGPRGRARMGLAAGRHRSGSPSGSDTAAGRQSRQPALAHPSRSLAAARRRAPGLRPPVRGGRSNPRRDRQGLRSGEHAIHERVHPIRHAGRRDPRDQGLVRDTEPSSSRCSACSVMPGPARPPC